MPRVKIALVVLTAAVVGVLLTLNTGKLTGPGFWAWSWRPIAALPVYSAILVGAIPIGMAMLVDRWSRWAAIGLLMVGCFGMKIGSVVAQTKPPSLQLISAIVENPDATSYYSDAGGMHTRPLREWMILFPELMKDLSLHSKTKPPGPILFWVMLINLLGYGGSTPLIGGLLLGAIATLSIPATYLLLNRLLDDPQAAFCGASFLSLCPGFVLFFPMFDPTYILLSSALIGTWHVALSRNCPRWSILLGVALAATCIITFNVLVIGLFMVGMIFTTTDRPMQRRLVVSAKLALIAFGSTVVVLGFFWLLTWYNPIETFKSAWVNQHALLETYRQQRLYPHTIPWDLVDLALGTGWLSFLLTGFYLVSKGKNRTELALAMLAIGQLVAVAVLGLLQLETARVWNFMFPLLLIPVSLELRTWPAKARLVPYAALLLLTAAVCQNVKLIY